MLQLILDEHLAVARISSIVTTPEKRVQNNFKSGRYGNDHEIIMMMFGT